MKLKHKYMWRAVFKGKNARQSSAQTIEESFARLNRYLQKHNDELIRFELVGESSLLTVEFSRPWSPIMFIDKYRRMGKYDKAILHREQKPVKDARLIAEVSGESGSEQYRVGYSFSDEQDCTRKKTITVV